MKEVIIKNIDEFHKHLNSYQKSGLFVYRGHSDIRWELIPKAGRPPYTNVDDANMFHHWKRRAGSYLDKELYTELDLLAIAQHTGLATRLLDWTYNPLAAAFFATFENHNVDGAIFSYQPKHKIKPDTANPFELKKGIGLIQPNAPIGRIANQLGYFSIHNSPLTPLNDKTKDGYIEKLIIKKEIKKELLFMLNQYGVNYLTLFPDLEGLSKHLCWFAENNEYWNKAFDDKI